MNSKLSMLLAALTLVVAAPGVAGELYGVFRDVAASRENLYTISTVTGSKTVVGSGIPGPFGVSSGVSAFREAGNGQVFVIATTDGSTSFRIFTIDAGTGSVTANPQLTAGYNHNFLAYDEVGGQLLGVFYKSSAGKEYLVSINTSTGAVTEIGTGIASCCGVSSGVSAIDSPGGRLFFVGTPNGGNQKIYTINVSTGAVSASPDMTAGYSANFIEYDSANSRLLGMFYKPSATKQILVSINTSTGAITEIGTGISNCCGVAGGVSAIDSAGGRLFFVGKPTGDTNWYIYAMNTSTGAVALSGSLGAESSVNPDFLEYQKKAKPVITWANPANITYGTTLSATQLNASANVAGTFVYTPLAGTGLAAGPHTLSTVFTPADSTNYTTASKSVSITVDKATPVITWANPASIVYGTALSGTQLNASVPVPGSFVYTPSSGTVLSASGNLSVLFTPADTANYTIATKSVYLVVRLAPFTDPTLTAGSTVIKAVHVDELRTRINDIRAARGLAPFSWSEPTLTIGATTIKASQILEMRTALAAAYGNAAMTPPTYTAPVPAAGVVVYASAISELRNAVLGIE